jgi:hypothetical protein
MFILIWGYEVSSLRLRVESKYWFHLAIIKSNKKQVQE